MIGRVVVATDGSGPSRAAGRWGAAHAARLGVPVVVIHVADEAHDDAPPSAQEPFGAETVMIRGPAVSRALADFVGPDDLLVLGTDKTGFIHSRVFGSRGIRIASIVRCSTVIVPEVDLRFRAGVVAGIDRDDGATLIARAAAVEADARAEHLDLVHSSHDEAVRAALPPHESVVERAAMAVALEWPGISVRARTTPVPASVARLDASLNAALLVLGAHDPDSSAPFGSVLHDVLMNINAPVLVLRRQLPR